MREFLCEQSVLSQADGSASFYQGDTNVLAAVYGPAECRAGRESVKKAYLDVIYKAKVGLPSSGDKLVEHNLRSVCDGVILGELFARSQVQVCVQEMCNAGSLLAATFNAVCMALMDSGVPMRTLLTAVTCAISDTQEDAEEKVQYVIDPDLEQEEAARCIITFVLDTSERDLLACFTSGCFAPAEYNKALALATKAGDGILAYYKASIKKRLEHQ